MGLVLIILSVSSVVSLTIRSIFNDQRPGGRNLNSIVFFFANFTKSFGNVFAQLDCQHDYPCSLFYLWKGLDSLGIYLILQVIGDKWEQYLLYVQEHSEG